MYSCFQCIVHIPDKTAYTSNTNTRKHNVRSSPEAENTHTHDHNNPYRTCHPQNARSARYTHKFRTHYDWPQKDTTTATTTISAAATTTSTTSTTRTEHRRWRLRFKRKSTSGYRCDAPRRPAASTVATATTAATTAAVSASTAAAAIQLDNVAYGRHGATAAVCRRYVRI